MASSSKLWTGKNKGATQNRCKEITRPEIHCTIFFLILKQWLRSVGQSLVISGLVMANLARPAIPGVAFQQPVCTGTLNLNQGTLHTTKIFTYPFCYFLFEKRFNDGKNAFEYARLIDDIDSFYSNRKAILEREERPVIKIDSS